MLEAQGQGTVTCRHRWLIEPPSGPMSKGVCSTCGAEGEFQNYAGDRPFGDTHPVRSASSETETPAKSSAASEH